MRITVHLDTFNCPDPSTYAILWLDTHAHKWSREGHAGIDLPEWGCYTCASGNTRIAGQHGGTSQCVLEGLDLSACAGPFEGESGRALWHRSADLSPLQGQWHVQCIDETAAPPESSVFADDPFAPGNPFSFT
jgi:uncharacterized protein DUF3564